MLTTIVTKTIQIKATVTASHHEEDMFKDQPITRAGENGERRTFTVLLAGYVQQCSHPEKQSIGSSKSRV